MAPGCRKATMFLTITHLDYMDKPIQSVLCATICSNKVNLINRPFQLNLIFGFNLSLVNKINTISVSRNFYNSFELKHIHPNLLSEIRLHRKI